MRYTDKFLGVLIGFAGSACVFETHEDYPPDEVLALSLCMVSADEESAADECVAPVLTANGVDRARITVEFPRGSGRDTKVLLTTSLGVLDPGKPEGMRSSTELSTSGVQDLSAILYAGVDSGEAIVRAAVGSTYVERVVTIAPATPTSLDVIGNVQLLTESALSTNLAAYLYNEEVPRAAVSSGVEVHFHGCRDAVGAVADVPRIVRTAAPNTGSVTTTVTLNAAGAALVGEVGPPEALDEELFVHAYVIGAGEQAPLLAEGDTCMSVEAALAGTEVRDLARLVLRRKSM